MNSNEFQIANCPISKSDADRLMRVGELASCPKCEYNLRGSNSGRCPECGFEFSVGSLCFIGRKKNAWFVWASSILAWIVIIPAGIKILYGADPTEMRAAIALIFGLIVLQAMVIYFFAWIRKPGHCILDKDKLTHGLGIGQVDTVPWNTVCEIECNELRGTIDITTTDGKKVHIVKRSIPHAASPLDFCHFLRYYMLALIEPRIKSVIANDGSCPKADAKLLARLGELTNCPNCYYCLGESIDSGRCPGCNNQFGVGTFCFGRKRGSSIISLICIALFWTYVLGLVIDYCRSGTFGAAIPIICVAAFVQVCESLIRARFRKPTFMTSHPEKITLHFNRGRLNVVHWNQVRDICPSEDLYAIDISLIDGDRVILGDTVLPRSSNVVEFGQLLRTYWLKTIGHWATITDPADASPSPASSVSPHHPHPVEESAAIVPYVRHPARASETPPPDPTNNKPAAGR